MAGPSSPFALATIALCTDVEPFVHHLYVELALQPLNCAQLLTPICGFYRFTCPEALPAVVRGEGIVDVGSKPRLELLVAPFAQAGTTLAQDVGFDSP